MLFRSAERGSKGEAADLVSFKDESDIDRACRVVFVLMEMSTDRAGRCGIIMYIRDWSPPFEERKLHI